MKHYYTDKQLKELVSNMVILIDTREKSNENIINIPKTRKNRLRLSTIKLHILSINPFVLFSSIITSILINYLLYLFKNNFYNVLLLYKVKE